ncbi:thiolase-like protein, partial [Dunaliella salina]
GDEAEQQAVLAALGADHGHRIAVSSTKGATGHLLGAAGAVETVFTVLALHHNVAPPTANLINPDPQILQGLVGVAAQPLMDGPKAALCNAFGFGGTNASLLLATP